MRNKTQNSTKWCGLYGCFLKTKNEKFGQNNIFLWIIFEAHLKEKNATFRVKKAKLLRKKRENRNYIL